MSPRQLAQQYSMRTRRASDAHHSKSGLRRRINAMTEGGYFEDLLEASPAKANALLWLRESRTFPTGRRSGARDEEFRYRVQGTVL
jgi:hypothetical protein